MDQSHAKLSKITAAAIVALGVSMFLSYMVYLPAPGLFSGANAANLGLILYGLATAGAAFVCWGIMLAQLSDQGLSRQNVLKATGIGIGMLALMRLGVAVFPHAPFDQIRYVPIGEAVVFTLIAVKFLKA